MGHPALLPIRRKVCCGFLSPLKSVASAGFVPVTLGSNGKHTNHYTTETTMTIIDATCIYDSPDFEMRQTGDNIPMTGDSNNNNNNNNE
jgi:hypothetical protein